MDIPVLRTGRSQWPETGIGPDSVEVRNRSLVLSDGVCASFAVTGYPAEVGPGWLEPLLNYPGRVAVSVHVEPVPPAVAANRLKKQLARLESTNQADREHGREDFAAQTASEDARELSLSLARQETRLFRLGLYITVHAPDDETLEAECEDIRAIASSMLLDTAPATFRPLQGLVTTLPLATDCLEMRRTIDTGALAAAFPFTSPDLDTEISDTAVLYGVNASSSSLVLWDRWAADNHNSTVLARSGAGKSYLTKLDILRSLYAGVEVAVIDPETEYQPLADAVGGTHIPLGAPGTHLNPFDLPATSPTDDGTRTHGDALTRRALFLHTLIATLVGQPLEPAEKAALDRSIIDTYAQAGITSDRRTWARPAPLLRDLADVLAADSDPASRQVAAHLAPYVTGTHRHLFAEPTSQRPDGHLVVFSLRELPDELRAAGTLLALDAVWRRVTNPHDRRLRLVVVDEAWLLMREPEGAKWLLRLAKSARKYLCGLATVTQDAADLLGSPLGQSIIANSATQILMRQAPQAIDSIAEAFGLSDGERQVLLSASRGEGLLIAGPQRAAFQTIASPSEHQIAVTGIQATEAPDVEDEL